MIVAILGDRLREARIRTGLTLEKAAESIGVKLNTVWRYEKGEIRPSEPVLRLCSQVYNRPVEWFYGEDVSEEPVPDQSPIEADRELVMNEASVALHSLERELSDEAIKSIADYIRFVHEREDRERRERHD